MINIGEVVESITIRSTHHLVYIVIIQSMVQLEGTHNGMDVGVDVGEMIDKKWSEWGEIQN